MSVEASTEPMVGVSVERGSRPDTAAVGATSVLAESSGLPAAPKREVPPWATRYARRLMVTDLLAVVWAGIGAHSVQTGSLSSRLSSNPLDPQFIALTAGLGLIWAFVLVWGRTRDSVVVGHGAEEYKRVIQSSLAFFGLAAICSYVFDLRLPRAYLLVMLPAGLLALLASRFLWRRWLHAKRRAGHFVSNVLAVGDPHTVHELIADLKRAPLSSYRVVGVCADPQLPLADVDGVPIFGRLDQVVDVAVNGGYDVVAVTSTASFGSSRVRQLGWELEHTDVDLVLAPALTNIAGPRVHTTPVAGLPLIHVDRPTYRGANRTLKRAFDLVVGGLIVAFASPVLLGIAVTMKLTDRGPVFFRQERIGVNGKSFRMTKFRSMVVDAEARLSELREAQRDAGNDVLFKMTDDPRITKVGKFLRRFSLDELPQLFNVIRGDMSLVGPRPPLRSEVELYEGEAMLRLLVKPGMTGLWQVSGRSDLSWEDSVRLDTYYVENWSITGDLVILFKTAKAVTSSAGAY